jgi:hypothetical protein
MPSNSKGDLLHLLQLGTTGIATNSPLATFEDSILIKLALAGQPESFAALTDRDSAAVSRRTRSLVRNATVGSLRHPNRTKQTPLRSLGTGRSGSQCSAETTCC